MPRNAPWMFAPLLQSEMMDEDTNSTNGHESHEASANRLTRTVVIRVKFVRFVSQIFALCMLKPL
jgi:hypothetical protein